MQSNPTPVLFLSLFLSGSAAVPTSQVVTKNPGRQTAVAGPAALGDLAKFLRHMEVLEVDDGLGNMVTTIRFHGANVQIVSGSGTTDGTVDGTGNLIVGYNEPRLAPEPNDRSGSHNLVVGKEHNFSGFGGLVGGRNNTLNANHSSVTGGHRNTASGTYSSVTGGQYNTASGTYSSASGGQYNTADGPYSSISAGFFNTASGTKTSVTGGRNNMATGGVSSISGGSNNTASANFCSISGGYLNTASSAVASVSGGRGNTASAHYSSVSGGEGNEASATFASVSGVRTNTDRVTTFSKEHNQLFAYIGCIGLVTQATSQAGPSSRKNVCFYTKVGGSGPFH